MEYHNKALEDSRLHIRAEIKDTKKTHRIQLTTKRFNDSIKTQEDLLVQTRCQSKSCKRLHNSRKRLYHKSTTDRSNGGKTLL